MADRMTVIAQLGTLITDAVQRGDDRATETLRDALELLVSDASTDRTLKARRSNDAERQRRKRDRESQDVTLRHVTTRDPSEVSPQTPLPNSQKHEDDDTARGRADAEAIYAESVDNLIAMLTDRVGDAWPDVDGFLKRRQFQTWAAWLKEMLSVLTGGQALPIDLAQVCRDDGALERPIGSPKGLRSFVANAVRDRLHPKETQEQPRRGGVAMRTFANGRDALRNLP